MALKPNETLHHEIFHEYVDFAWSYLSKKKSSVRAALVSDKKLCEAHTMEDSDVVMSYIGSIYIPEYSKDLIYRMARFSWAPVYGMIDGLSSPSKDSFHTSSLLWAGYPKNIDTGIFKNTAGGISAGAPMDNSDKDRCEHAAFSGLSLIILNNIRDFFDPLATDREIMTYADNSWLCVY